ncbi:MAG: nucleotide exchange factor GrpE [Halobacteriales archaeon]|nr:nucleotide exchange factor GrpE [Halobacteriales archaeon]
MTEAEESPDAEDDEPTETESPSEDQQASGIEELIAQVAAHDEELATAVGDLSDRVADLESELQDRTETVEDLESRLKRAHADLQNYKKRTEREQERIKERATKELTERLLDVRDNLVRALEQDEDADIRDGVEATLSTFDRILADEGISEVRPEPGEDVDPMRHEVVFRVESERPDGAIAEVYRPGYELGDDIVRPAQVAVAEPPEEEADEESTADEEAKD